MNESGMHMILIIQFQEVMRGKKLHFHLNNEEGEFCNLVQL
jgi:hypothetical protein